MLRGGPHSIIVTLREQGESSGSRRKFIELYCFRAHVAPRRPTADWIIIMQQDHCEGCGEIMANHDVVHFGSMDKGYRKLCTRCVNAEIAKLSGLEDFENIRLDPIGITDCAGESHQFHFRTRLLGDIVSLEAFELREGNPAGYRFQMVGDPEDDLFALLGRLIQKIRRTLSIRHLKEIDGHGLQIADDTVRGRIEWGESEDGRVPLLVVDGREISWEDFGSMLMSFEGWQFKLEILDPSDEV